MSAEFEKKIISKLDQIATGIHGLDELNRNIEKLIKLLIEKKK